MRIDMHIHSNRSRDASASPEEIVAQAKAVGLAGFCVTDHNSIDGSLRTVELARAEGLVSVVGVEVSSSDGHVLAYGVEGLPERGLAMDDTIDRIHALGGIAVAAHPWRFPSGMGRVLVMKGGFDAIEVLNGGNSSRANRHAAAVADARSLPKVAGSDAHKIAEIGRSYTVVDDLASGDDLIAAVTSGRTRVEGRSRTARETAVYAVETLYEWCSGGFRRL